MRRNRAPVRIETEAVDPIRFCGPPPFEAQPSLQLEQRVGIAGCCRLPVYRLGLGLLPWLLAQPVRQPAQRGRAVDPPQLSLHFYA